MSEGRQIEGIHELVVVEGPDARPFLDGLVSQDLTSLDSTRPVRSFLLAPQGKLRALLWITGEGERVELVTNAGWGKKLAEDLRHYKIRVKATIAEPVPVTTIVGSDGFYTFSSVPVELPTMSYDEWNAMRIEAGEPVMGIDVDESTIPQETGLVEQSVSFSKGCFLGQELVARLDSRQGRVNRHLRWVRLASLPELPAPVADEGGFITSAAWNGNHAIGLGLLHRRIEPGNEILVSGIRAAVL
jgi:folate-binding protein YgfZ